MPQLDYKNAVLPSTGVWGQPRSFYTGEPGRRVVRCPDCGGRADELFRDHGGDCTRPLARRHVSPLEVVRRYALEHRFFSANELRPLLNEAGASKGQRGRLLQQACENRWIRATDRFVPSTDPATKGHPIRVYASLTVSGVAID